MLHRVRSKLLKKIEMQLLRNETDGGLSGNFISDVLQSTEFSDLF